MSLSEKLLRKDPTQRRLLAETTADTPIDKLVVTIAPAFNDEAGVWRCYALQYRLVCLSFWERGNGRRSFEDVIRHALEKARNGCVFDPPPSSGTPMEVLVEGDLGKVIDAFNKKQLVIACGRSDQAGFEAMNYCLYSRGVPIYHRVCDPKNGDHFKLRLPEGLCDEILKMLSGTPPPVVLLELGDACGSQEEPAITLPQEFRNMKIIVVSPNDGFEAALEEIVRFQNVFGLMIYTT